LRILFDQGTPVPLRRYLPGHSVATAFEIGWAEFANGDLLLEAEKQFEALVTTDQNLHYQQNLARRRLAILILPFASLRFLYLCYLNIGGAERCDLLFDEA
jgi:hypothetical protein